MQSKKKQVKLDNGAEIFKESRNEEAIQLSPQSPVNNLATGLNQDKKDLMPIPSKLSESDMIDLNGQLGADLKQATETCNTCHESLAKVNLLNVIYKSCGFGKGGFEVTGSALQSMDPFSMKAWNKISATIDGKRASWSLKQLLSPGRPPEPFCKPPPIDETQPFLMNLKVDAVTQLQASYEKKSKRLRIVSHIVTFATMVFSLAMMAVGAVASFGGSAAIGASPLFYAGLAGGLFGLGKQFIGLGLHGISHAYTGKRTIENAKKTLEKVPQIQEQLRQSEMKRNEISAEFAKPISMRAIQNGIANAQQKKQSQTISPQQQPPPPIQLKNFTPSLDSKIKGDASPSVNSQNKLAPSSALRRSNITSSPSTIQQEVKNQNTLPSHQSPLSGMTHNANYNRPRQHSSSARNTFTSPIIPQINTVITKTVQPTAMQGQNYSRSTMLKKLKELRQNTSVKTNGHEIESF